MIRTTSLCLSFRRRLPFSQSPRMCGRVSLRVHPTCLHSGPSWLLPGRDLTGKTFADIFIIAVHSDLVKLYLFRMRLLPYELFWLSATPFLRFISTLLNLVN